MAKRQYFTTLDDAELDKLGGLCRECKAPRDDTSSKVKGWIRGNTKIGPALDVAVSHHQGRYGIEIMINSFFGDGICSWVMIVNGITKYVTEMSEETQENHIDDNWRQFRETWCWSKTETNINADDFLFSGYVTISTAWLDRRRTRSVCQDLFRSVKKRWSDCFDTILQYFEKKTEQLNSGSWHGLFRSEFTSSQHWSIRTWLNYLQKRGGPKKRYQYCVDPYSANTILYFRTMQGHSGGKHRNPTLQDNVLLPDNAAEHIYHVGSSHDMHSIIQPGLIPGGKGVKKGIPAMFFTAVKPMFIDQHGERDYDVTKPRIAVYKHIWKIHQNTVNRCNLRVAHSNGLQFYQTRSNAIILYSTVLAVCIEKVVIRKLGEKCAAKRINFQLDWKELYLNRTCIMDARTRQALTRERLSTILASTEKLVAVERTRKLVAVKLTSGSKDCSIRLSKGTITSARKQSKSWLINSRRIQIEKIWNQTWSKITRSIHSASSRRKWSAAKETWVLWDLRSHSRSTVPQLYDILDERHCILHLRNMLETFRQNSKIKQRSLWCFVDSNLRDEERTISRCTSREHREAKNLPRSSRLSSRLSQKGKEKRLQIHIG